MASTSPVSFIVRVPAEQRAALKSRMAPPALRDFGISTLTQRQTVAAALNDYLEQEHALPAEKMGRTEGVGLLVELEPDLADRVLARAEQEGRPKGHLVRAAIAAHLTA